MPLQDQPDEPVKIVIFGVGAMGCLYGAYLSPDYDVTLVGTWPEQIAALNSRRLTVRYADHRRDVYVDLNARPTPQDLADIDYALILTKSTQTERAAKIARTLLKEDGLCIPIQNGIGNFEVAAEQVGEDNTSLGTTTMGAAIEAPGVIRFGGEGVTYLATRPIVDHRVRTLAKLFQQAGMQTEVTKNIDGILWGKLVINCAINALTAILRVNNGVLVTFEDSHARELVEAAAVEAAAVAKANGIKLPYANPAERAIEVAEATAENTSSMLQDVLRQTTTEIEMINGAVVRAGKEAGVETPVNSMLYNLVKALEETYEYRQK